MQANEVIEGVVENLAFGGQGIIRNEGKVIFVPFSAPGDLITCKITHVKKSFAFGTLLTVEKPSSDRIYPKCPYFGTCGGCQIQHLNEKAQIIYKRQCVEEALLRIGKIDLKCGVDVIPSSTKWAYRRHITLRINRVVKSSQVGYIAADHHTFLSIQCCPIFHGQDDPILANVQEFIDSLKNFPQSGKLTLLKNHNRQYILHFTLPFTPKEHEKNFSKALTDYSNWSGILLSTPYQTFSYGQIESQISINSLTFTFNPGMFIQNHPEQSARIYHEIKQISKESEKHRILDLYCGIGISTLLIAKESATVTGIEYNPEAIRIAKTNALRNGINNVSFIASDVEKVLAKEIETQRPTLIVMNPPRTGLSSQSRSLIAHSKARELIYISCFPSTLARDLQEFCSIGYKVVKCKAYDMFPQTGHVETLVHLLH